MIYSHQYFTCILRASSFFFTKHAKSAPVSWLYKNEHYFIVARNSHPQGSSSASKQAWWLYVISGFIHLSLSLLSTKQNLQESPFLHSKMFCPFFLQWS